MLKVERNRMLIVDDEEAETMQRSFQKLGWDADIALDGKTAIDKIGQAYENANPYQVVILDYRLPDINGFLVMKEIAQRWRDQCVVFVTGVARSFEDAVEGMQFGACGYLQKPFHPEIDELEILKAIQINQKRQIPVVFAKGIVHQVGGRTFTSASRIQRVMKDINQFSEAYRELKHALEDIRAIEEATYRFRLASEPSKRREGIFDLKLEEQRRDGILIVDDQEAETLQRTFDKLGWNVVDIAKDGETAIKMIEEAYRKKKPYQVVFLDYLLQLGRNGFWVMEEIAQRWQEQCVVFITGIARSTEDAIRGLQRGACGYLQKPFHPEIDELEIFRAIQINQERQKPINLAKEIVHQVGERASIAASHIQCVMQEINQPSEAHDELEQSLEDFRAIEEITYRFHVGSDDLKRGEGTCNLDQAVQKAIKRSSERFAFRWGPHRMPSLRNSLEADVEISGAALWIEEVCAVIIDNALEAVAHKKHEGLVGIRTKSDADQILISIQDNGVGIPEENEDRIFESGFTTRPGRGTGQGLAFAKYVVEQLYKGEILFLSTEGEGTEFIISLPRQ